MCDGGVGSFSFGDVFCIYLYGAQTSLFEENHK